MKGDKRETKKGDREQKRMREIRDRDIEKEIKVREIEREEERRWRDS